MKETYNNELTILNSLWNQTGVTDKFKLKFESIALDLDSNLKKSFFDFEILNLNFYLDQTQVIINLNIFFYFYIFFRN